MTVALVLPRKGDPAGPALWELAAPLLTPGEGVELWLPSEGEGEEGWELPYHEAYLRRLEALWEGRRPELILFPETVPGHELGARFSARLGCPCFTEVRSLSREGNRLLLRRRVCGFHLEAESLLETFPAVLTVLGKPGNQGPSLPELLPVRGEALPLTLPRWLLEYRTGGKGPANPLETAPLVFAGGRGLGSLALCNRLRGAAKTLGAALGLSRPGALNGWGQMEEIIGQSGVRTGAETCLAVGVSGAAAFMAGIEGVRTLIAVNPDSNAPIFQYADLGILATAEEFLSALEKELAEKEPGDRHDG